VHMILVYGILRGRVCFHLICVGMDRVVILSRRVRGCPGGRIRYVCVDGAKIPLDPNGTEVHENTAAVLYVLVVTMGWLGSRGQLGILGLLSSI
jgi:hypothetical protein